MAYDFIILNNIQNMKYWYLDEKNEVPGICGSMKSIEEQTGVNYQTLVYHFTRMNRTQYRKNGIWIVKVEVKTSKRK